MADSDGRLTPEDHHIIKSWIESKSPDLKCTKLTRTA
jgi:hypothetical protein